MCMLEFFRMIPRLLFVVVLVFFASVSTSFAQETEELVVDEVVAQVNDGVITLSRVKREMKAIIDAQVGQGRPLEEVQREVNEKQGELIANLINEELLLQRAKELGLDRDVEAEVNKRFLQVMRENNLKTLEAVYTEMRKNRIEPDEIRDLWRKQITRELVIQREVQAKEYWRPNGAELQKYYTENKAKFTKPETVTLSEIFLAFAGRTEESVRAKAKQLVTQLRAGADFVKLVAENSDRPNAAETKGKVETLKVADLDPKFANAIKGVNTGGYTDPVEIDQIGVNIIRVDERSAASSESVFDESAVRMAILNERFPEASKKFMASLREDSYIKINDGYRPLVAPILFADERKTKASN